MKKTVHIINIISFTVLLAVMSPLLLIAERPEYSEVERRKLEGFPKFTLGRLFSGDFTRELNIFYSDTIPMRDSISEASSFIKSKWGFSVDGVTIHNPTIPSSPYVPDTPSDASKPAYNASQTDVQPETPSPPVWDGQIGDEANYVEEDNVNLSNEGVLVYKNRALMVTGWVLPAGERYARAMNEYSRVLNNGSKEVNVYSMVAPTSIEFYCPKNYIDLYNIDQRGSINHINSFLENITPVNAYSALASRTGEDIYMRTDHHWAALGAYYAAEQFALTAGAPFTPLSKYEKVTIPDYVGTMYGFSGKNPDIKNNPEDFIYYKPTNKYEVSYNIIYEGYDPEETVKASLFDESMPLSESYGMFLGGDPRITHITTDVDNSRVLAVLKDSYGNALIPFLTGSFKEIYVIDIRYFPYNSIDYLEGKGVTDLLFANNIAVANDDYFINMIKGLTEK